MLRRTIAPILLTYLAFAAQLVDANPIRYVAIGDSYTVATGIDEKDSWPSQLTQKLKSAGIEINLIEILGMKGATSQQTLNEVMPLLKNLKPGLITVANKTGKQREVIKIDAQVLDEFEEQLEFVLTKILNNDFEQTSEVKNCEWCDYKSVCKR